MVIPAAAVPDAETIAAMHLICTVVSLDERHAMLLDDIAVVEAYLNAQETP